MDAGRMGTRESGENLDLKTRLRPTQTGLNSHGRLKVCYFGFKTISYCSVSEWKKGNDQLYDCFTSDQRRPIRISSYSSSYSHIFVHRSVLLGTGFSDLTTM